jgi:hypothetical protein
MHTSKETNKNQSVATEIKLQSTSLVCLMEVIFHERRASNS